jgi:hypothetical protein
MLENKDPTPETIEDPVIDHPSKNSVPNIPDNKYVILMETSGEECESWYYCIKYEGNQENLEHLQEQLESVKWYVLDDLSTFDLDLEHFICERTAKELTKLDFNYYSSHRKFDGILGKIDLKLRTKDKNKKKMVKVFDILGYGRIEDFIDKEDRDEEDFTDYSGNSSSLGEESSDSESSDDSDDSVVKKNTKNTKNTKKTKGIPAALLKSTLPRFAKAKRRQRKNP